MDNQDRTTETPPATTPQLATVPQFCERHPAFTQGGIRHLLFIKGHEAEEAGAVVRFGRKLLIDEAAFLCWIKNGGARQIAGGRR
jgi:hypothetical protein